MDIRKLKCGRSKSGRVKREYADFDPRSPDFKDPLTRSKRVKEGCENLCFFAAIEGPAFRIYFSMVFTCSEESTREVNCHSLCSSNILITDFLKSHYYYQRVKT